MMASQTTKRLLHPNRGFTLMELVVSLGVTSAVAVGLSAALMLAARSLPATAAAEANDQLMQKALATLNDDLKWAMAQLPSEDNHLRMLTSDLTGDGVPDVVDHHWENGIWQRQINDEPTVRLAQGNRVKMFALANQQTHTQPGPLDWGPVSVLAGMPVGNNTDDITPETDEYIGQIVRPTLPFNALAWRLTHFDVVADTPLTDLSRIDVDLRQTDSDGLPTGDAVETLETTPLTWNHVGTYDTNGYDQNEPDDMDWYRFAFSKIAVCTPSQTMAVCFTVPSSLGASTDFLNERNLGSGLLIDNKGKDKNWKIQNDGLELIHRAWGQVALPTDETTWETNSLLGVNIAWQAADGAIVEHLLGTPKRPVPRMNRVWWADMSQSPLAFDLNADGSPDWDTTTAAAFNADKFKDGLWTCEGVLRTDDTDFPTPTVFRMRGKMKDANDMGTTLTWAVDPNGLGTSLAWLAIKWTLQDDGHQRLDAFVWQGTAWVHALPIDGLGGEALDLVFVLHPENNTLSININGQDRGTLSYEQNLALGARKGFTLDGSNAAVLLDRLSIETFAEGGTP